MARRGHQIIRLVIVLLVLAALYGGYEYTQTHPHTVSNAIDNGLAWLGQRGRPQQKPGIAASGTIEADTVRVMSLIPGRVLTVTVAEGDDVTSGQLLLRLDDSLLQKQLTSARAQIDLARARLALLQAGPRPEEVARAQAQVNAAQTAVDVATQVLEDARRVREAAQDLQPDLVRAETGVEQARYERDAALALAQAADLTTRLWQKINDQVKAGVDVPLPNGQVRHMPPPQDKLNEVSYRWNLASQQAWETWAHYRQAEAALSAARARLQTTRAQLTDPAREAPVARAEGQLEQARGNLAAAQASLQALQEGVNKEKIEAARAAVEQAQAAYARLLVQRRFYRLQAPRGGRVLERAIEPGEVATPGVPLLTLADLSTLHLTLYIPEDQLGRVRLGQTVSITVDAYPSRTFHGSVVHISDKAEFTPKNVQTREDRQILVYAVRVDIPNPDRALKPGMPADAIIQSDEK